ncbi:MAG: hypothetical protein R3C18_18710 [Planctomycetaceae bacterium]
MDLVRMTCGSCGGPLELQENVKFVKCEFCGTQLEVHVKKASRRPESRKVVQEQTVDTRQLKLEAELRRVEREWVAARKNFRGPFDERDPQASGQLGTLLFVIVFAISTTFITTGWVIKSHTTTIPSTKEIMDYGLAHARASRPGSPDQLPSLLTPHPRARRDKILRDRMISKRCVIASLAVDILPAIVYAMHTDEIVRFKGFSVAKDRYQRRRAKIESAIKRLAQQNASKDFASIQLPPPLPE